MPCAMRIYKTLQMMYEEYSAKHIAEKLIVDKVEYRLIGSRRKGSIWVHAYRSNQEQHNLIVYLRSDMPFLIKPVYSVNGIRIEEI